MFRLIATLKRGVGTDLDEVGTLYATLEDARRAAQMLAHHDVVSHVMIAREGVPPAFVEWAVY
ncbi:MAG TPA: hypothetical protein VLV86_06000 [Vicinamibacterales bacterium]|nr:hypothetical protein [Vicinamibacterales bacterium]